MPDVPPVMRGAITEPILDFAFRAMRIVVIVLLATNTSASSKMLPACFSILFRRAGYSLKLRSVSWVTD